MKTCSVCHESKPLEDFYRQRNSPDGRNYTCKTCSRARSASWKAENPERVKEIAERGNAKPGTHEPAMTGEKTCNACHEAKPVTEFYVQRRSPDGRGYTCKACSRERSVYWGATNRHRSAEVDRDYWQRHKGKKNAGRRARRREDTEFVERDREKKRQHYQANRESILAERQATKHGMTVAEFRERVENQKGCCAICGRPCERLAVDHDHACCPDRNKSCGKCIRGLLCTNCNTGLGMFADDPVRLRAAILYLA